VAGKELREGRRKPYLDKYLLSYPKKSFTVFTAPKCHAPFEK
jgi:hypothetical protein